MIPGKLYKCTQTISTYPNAMARTGIIKNKIVLCLTHRPKDIDIGTSTTTVLDGEKVKLFWFRKRRWEDFFEEIEDI